VLVKMIGNCTDLKNELTHLQVVMAEALGIKVDFTEKRSIGMRARTGTPNFTFYRGRARRKAIISACTFIITYVACIT
jgi:hypothetical protein